MNEQKGTPVSIALVLEEYKDTLRQTMDDLILLRAYVKQLESQMKELALSVASQSQQENIEQE